MKKALRAGLESVRAACARKKRRYWILAAVFAAAGWGASKLLDGASFWVDLKYDTYVVMQNLRGGPPRVPETTLVDIGDAEYYGPELAARRPLKRDYLARLVTAIAESKPRLLALDVDFRSPNPAGSSRDFADYAAEDGTLFQALCAAQTKTEIVISKTVYPVEGVGLVADSNIYDGNHFCAMPRGHIHAGFLGLPTDLRRVPLQLTMHDGAVVDSFALAAARALAPRQYPESFDLAELPFGRFHAVGEFRRVDASMALGGGARSDIEGQIVIVYGDWHVLANGRGAPVVDTFRTPVGVAGGAFVHANLIETLLAAEYRIALPESAIVLLDALVAAGLAIGFAFPMGLGRKFLWLAATASGLCVTAWLFFQVFAVFFDILPMLAAMYLHAVADQVEEWREAAHAAGRA